MPTPGVERWLSQGLAQRLGAEPGRSDGVCAGVDFPSPRRLVARALAGTADEEDIDPWQPHRAVWPLLRVIDGCRGRTLGGFALALPGRRRTLRRIGPAARRTTVVHRATSRRPLRQVRGDPADHDRQLVSRQRPGRLGGRFRPIVLGRPNSGVGFTVSSVFRARSNACKPGWPKLRHVPESSDLPERLSVFGATGWIPTTCSYSQHSPTIATSTSGWLIPLPPSGRA